MLFQPNKCLKTSNLLRITLKLLFFKVSYRAILTFTSGNGEKHDFYIMKVLENGMVIMIPIRNVESVGLRDIINQKEIPKVYELMKVRTDGVPAQTWNRRYREYMDKIKTGSLYDVAEVFRDLSLLKLTKDLSFGERKLFDTAQVLLVRELSTAKNTDEETIISEIESFFDSDSLEN